MFILVVYDKDWSYVLTSEPQTLRLTFTFIDVNLHCQSAMGEKIEKEELIHVYIIYCQLQKRWFFQSR